jgi:hypothetical protein
MKVSRAERETIIRRAADEQTWNVWTEDPKVVRELTQKFGPGSSKGILGLEWELDPGCVSFRRKARRTPAQIAEQRRSGIRLAKQQAEIKRQENA